GEGAIAVAEQNGHAVGAAGRNRQIQPAVAIPVADGQGALPNGTQEHGRVYGLRESAGSVSQQNVQRSVYVVSDNAVQAAIAVEVRCRNCARIWAAGVAGRGGACK